LQADWTDIGHRLIHLRDASRFTLRSGLDGLADLFGFVEGIQTSGSNGR
jgi:hypothetical protein